VNHEAATPESPNVSVRTAVALVELCAAIDRRLEQLRSEAPSLPVIEVDTDEVDYAINPAAVQAITRELTTSLKLPTEVIHVPAGAAGNQA
jgi:hypothetical protein